MEKAKFRFGLIFFVLLSIVSHLDASTCYGSLQRLNAPYGVSYSLSSPNYPWRNYYSNQNCYWYIAAPSGMQVKVTFNSFNLQSSTSCTKDYVEVRDGSSSSSTFISRYCSSKIPPIIISKGRYLYIKFHSDFSFQYRGFNLRYTTVYPVTRASGKCSSSYSFGVNNDIQMTSESGTITSPGYPLLYPSNMQCTWKIRVPSNKKIRLNIDYMSMQATVFCSADYLQVRDGYYSSSSKKGDYCGSTRKTIYSSGSYLWIRFRSDYSYNYMYKGFKLSYSTQESSTSVGMIIGILIAIALIIGIVIAIVYCMKKKRSHGTVVQNSAATTTITTAPPQGQAIVIPPPQGPPPYDQQQYPQKGQPYPGPPPQGQPNPYPGPPLMGQPNPYPGPPPPGQPISYPGQPPLGQPIPYPGPPPPGQPNPYPGPPPPGQPNPYPGPPPPGQSNPYPGPPPLEYPNKGGPPTVSM